MKLILGKPIVVGQGPTLEEADWGPWQFPQLLRRRHAFCKRKSRTGQLGVKRRYTVVQVIGPRSNLDGKHPDRSRDSISESKKR